MKTFECSTKPQNYTIHQLKHNNNHSHKFIQKKPNFSAHHSNICH